MEGTQVELTIIRDSGDGRGIAHLNGLTIFVPSCLAGEKVLARIVQVKKNHALAQLVKVIEPSPQRAEPPCPYFGICGGCSMQHMDYRYHLSIKENSVTQSLKRIGGVDPLSYEALPILGMDNPWRYRNKAIYMINKGRIGFFQENSRAIIDIRDCMLVSDDFTQGAQATKRILDGQEDVRSLMLRQAQDGGILAVLSTDGPHLKAADKWVDEMRSTLPSLQGVIHGVNTPRDGEAIGSECRLLWGQDRLTDYLGSIKVSLSPYSFAQINRIQALRLYEAAVDMCALTGKEHVLDAYCGAGVLTQMLARNAQSVTGIEIVPSAVRDAMASAEQNNCSNVEFIRGACEKIMASYVNPIDILVLDPPRRGCDEAVLQAAVRQNPQRIVYISCDPATLARDVKRLAQGGYRVAKLQPVDMFPWTGHVECIALISRN